ncbi:CCHC-type domain-containing protein [Abeliophyllum distichum]|uniref:CCHC-type domain-containing protein n=1 Tax=Abeliophyllum distichum TaxID=126358 RepID=A0ABD1PD55_9LAMI
MSYVTDDRGSGDLTWTWTSMGTSSQKGQVGRPKTQGRVFAVTWRDAKESPDVVMDVFSIFGRNARCLIDSCTTHSFISYAFAIHADRMLEPLDSGLSCVDPSRRFTF